MAQFSGSLNMKTYRGRIDRKQFIMSKLSNSLKSLINSPSSRPGTVPAPRNIQSVFHKIQQDAESNDVSQPSWVALSVCYILLAIAKHA